MNTQADSIQNVARYLPEFGHFIKYKPIRSQIEAVTLRVLNDQLAEKQKKLYIQSDRLTNEDGCLFSLHLGTLSDYKRCMTCYHTRQHCQGHFGILTLEHPFILPPYIKEVERVLRKLCFTPACQYRIIESSKRCIQCGIPAPVIKKSGGAFVVIVHNKKEKSLLPEDIKNIFNTLSLDDIKSKLGIGVFPSDFISYKIIVSPPMIRPDKKVQAQYKNTDENTMSLQHIVQLAKRLNGLNKSDIKFNKVMDEFVQSLNVYFKGEIVNGEEPNNTKSLSGSFMTKHGRIRNGILAKRVNFMARDVICCKPNLDNEAIEIPLEFAMTLLIPQVVRDYNKEQLTALFNNGPSIYPGAKYVVKPDGKKFIIGNPGITLEEGDTIYRHMIDGDLVLMNRNPSLTRGSANAHKIVVTQQAGSNVTYINVLVCAPYHADFDGDEMNVIGFNKLVSQAEAQFIAMIYNKAVTMQNGDFETKQIQDSVIGNYLMTKDSVSMDLVFASRIHQNSKIRYNINKYKQDIISGKQTLSLILPVMNFKTKSEFYMPEYSKYIQYKETDKMLKIELGEIKEGYFDKSGNQFQEQIMLTHNFKIGMQIAFSIQQAAIQFNKYAGFTIGIKDIYIPPSSRQLLQAKKDKMMQQGYNLILNYVQNNLYSPSDKTKHEYLYDKLMGIFFEEGVEELIKVVGTEGNEVRNNFYNMMMTGTKGKATQIHNMLAFIGFALFNNEPIQPKLQGRMNIFFKLNDIDPRSRGIIMNSYLAGLCPYELLANAVSERVNMLQKVLTVARPGAFSRIIIKNLEVLQLYNTRIVGKRNMITQFLFGGDGYSVQYVYKYKIPDLFLSYDQFKLKQLSQVKQLLQTQQDTQLCEKHIEFVQLLLVEYKENSERHATVNDAFQVTDAIQIPIAIDTIVETRLQQLTNKDQSAEYLRKNIVKLQSTINKLKYIYFNSYMMKHKPYVPRLYDAAATNLKIAFATTFNMKILSVFNPQQLKIILKELILRARQCLLEYGTAIGINSAQSVQNHITQQMLDSIHKTGTKKVMKAEIDRLAEILSLKKSSDINPAAVIKIPLVLGTPKEKAEIIAGKIKLIKFSHLIKMWDVIFVDRENFKDATYEFHTDKELFEDFQKPKNVTSWCLRTELDKMKMFINNISLQEIKEALSDMFDGIIITNKESDPKLIMRLYIGDKVTFNNHNTLRDIIFEILEFNVRGLKSIISTSVIDVKKKFIDDATGEVKDYIQYCIVAEGDNLRDIFRLQHIYKEIEYSQITCDNPPLISKWFGVQAAQQKIHNEMKHVLGTVNTRHLSMMANEMGCLGKLTAISPNGLEQRNPNNYLLHIAESRPVAGFINSSIQGTKSYLDSLSASLLVGQTPRSGTQFNTFILDTKLYLKYLYDKKHDSWVTQVE